MTTGFESFGRANRTSTHSLTFEEASAQLRGRTARSLLAYGNGRSYGDSCQNIDGALIDMRSHAAALHIDPDAGVIEADAGVLLADIITAAAPHGLFPMVVPGTRFVTLGGAIANDIHGKNHHRRGTFGGAVESLTLLRSDGRTLTCSLTENAGLFAATIGGMGLTGLILSARIKLMRVASLDVEETATGFNSVESYFDLAERADSENEYAVAWIDQLSRGKSLGRGVLLAGNHASNASGPAPLREGRTLSVPFQPPFTVLSRPAIAAFNTLYRWSRLRKSSAHRASWQSFFFPLDGVRHWNRLYGPNGLYQHQSAIPFDAARTVIPAMLLATHRAGQASFLTVLKRFGNTRSPGLLSFPRPGYTLTLDFPNKGAMTLALLAELDTITVAAGGAVNPYKDARMSAQTFAASFPNWRELEAQRDPAFVSDFWRRTALAFSSSQGFAHAAE